MSLHDSGQASDLTLTPPHTELAFCKLVGGAVRHRVTIDQAFDFLEKAWEASGHDWAETRHVFRKAVEGLRSQA